MTGTGMGSVLAGLLRLRASDATSSAALRASLERVREAHAACRARIADMEAKRGAVLLDGTPAEVEAHEAALVAEGREGARLSALAAELAPRIAAAEGVEVARRLDDLAAEAEGKAERGAALVPEIVRAASRLAALVDEHDALTSAVREANATLRSAGRERVALPTARAWPNDPNGERVALLGPALRLPGPRGECCSGNNLRREVERATAGAAGA